MGDSEEKPSGTGKSMKNKIGTPHLMDRTTSINLTPPQYKGNREKEETQEAA